VAMTQEEYDAWVAEVKQSAVTLDAAAYAELAKPSEAHPVTYYSSVEAGLFHKIMSKYDSGMVMGGTMAAE